MGGSILVVEDEAAVRHLLAANLQRAGYKVMCAGDVPQAEALVRDTRPDLVLLDWVLPDTPGVTRLLVRVRAGPGYRCHGLPRLFSRLVVRVVHFIMQRKQLLGIRSRAERCAAAHPIGTVIPPHGTQDAAPERRAS